MVFSQRCRDLLPLFWPSSLHSDPLPSILAETLTQSRTHNTQISNDAIIKADLVNPQNSQFHGWEPTIQQIPFKLNAVAKSTVTVFSQPVLALTIDVIGLPAYEAALKMKLPQLTANLNAVSSTAGNGVCGDRSKTTGVQIAADIGVDLTFRVGEDSQDGSGTLYETQLFVSCAWLHPCVCVGVCVLTGACGAGL